MSSTSVYDAEREVFKKRFEGNGMHMRLADATELVHKFLGPEWTVRRTATSRSTSGSWCYSEAKMISLAPDAGMPVVLHEIAHGLDADNRGHGLEFQRIYIELVRKEMSDVWGDRLRNAFIRHRCKGWKTLLTEKVAG